MAAMCSFSPSLPFFFCRLSPVLRPAGSHATDVRGSSTPVIFCASSYSVSSTALVSLSEGCRDAFSLFFSSIRTSYSSSRSYLRSSSPSSLRARMAVRGPIAARCAGRKLSSSSSSLRRRVLSTSSYGTLTSSSTSGSWVRGISLRRFDGWGGRRWTLAEENWSSLIISRPGRNTRSTPSSSRLLLAPFSFSTDATAWLWSPL
mmetsp:Transcript_27796/g.70014  ORF Transcript_27796/g.70014 Transcript_27796/m.70014 type:complete len:203 (-) Transcript_27796:337-945(-)